MSIFNFRNLGIFLLVAIINSQLAFAEITSQKFSQLDSNSSVNRVPKNNPAKIKRQARLRKALKVRQQAQGRRKKAARKVVSGLPDRQFDDDKSREEAKRGTVTGEGLRVDKPAEAAEFFKEKRLPAGEKEFSSNRYFAALDQVQKMQHYSLASGKFIQPSDSSRFSTESLPVGWSWLGPGNIGGRTRALVIHPTTPDTMYAAGVSGGIWKTTNAGAQWTPIADMLASINVCTLAMDPANPNIIYAGTGEYYTNFRGAGIFKTMDAGATWVRLATTNTSDFHYLFDIVVSPNNSQRIYAATTTGIFRSLDGGTSWTQIFSGLTYDLAIRSDKSIDDLLVGGFGQFHRNPDAAGSGTWTATFSEAGMRRTALAIAPNNQNIVYAIGVSDNTSSPYYNALHAFYQSTDGGQTWTAKVRNTDPTSINTSLLSYVGGTCNAANGFSGQGWYDLAIGVDPVDANRVWVGGITLFRSDDGGANWGVAALGGSSYVHPDNHGIVFHPNYNGTSNQTIFAVNDGGVYRSDNSRAATVKNNTALCNNTNPSISWRPINNNYGVTQFYHGAVYPDGKTYIGGTQDNGTARGSDSGGPNAWGWIHGGDGGYVAVDPTNPNILYAERTNLSLVKSTNGGGSWSAATNGISGDPAFRFIAPFTMDRNDSQRLWIGGVYLWRTSDGAANWTRASQAMNTAVSAIAVAPSGSNYVAAGTGEGELLVTTAGTTADANTVWSSAKPRFGTVSWMAFDPVNGNTVYATFSTYGGKHVWKSTNLGVTWTSIDGSGGTGLPDIPVHCIVIDPANTQRLFLGTDVGVFVSLDGGATWASENTGFANVIVETLVLNTANGISTLYAFTHGRGVWRVEVGGCIYSLTANSQKFDSTGGSGNVTVIPVSASGCTWTATSNTPWITVNNFNSTTVNYSVAANSAGASRVGSMTIAGRTFEVTQGCNSISTTSVSVPSLGGATAVNVNVPVGGCPWTAISNVPWIQVISGSSGSTNGTVNLNVDIANSNSPRTGTLTIAGQTVTVTQAGATQLPTLTSINPNTVIKGGAAFTLTATGTNFTANSVIVFKGVNYATTFVNSTQLTAQISGSAITAEGTFSVQVVTPVSGGGISTAQSLTINNTVPTLTSLSPAGAEAGITSFTSFTLTVSGTNFANNSIVRWNGADRATTFVSGTQLKAQILLADIANAGTASVTVFTPAPGGGTSAALTLNISGTAPTLTSISPNTVIKGGAAFTLTATGTNFSTNSVIVVKGVNYTTTFVSSTQLTAQLSAADIASVGILSVLVMKPGGGTSTAQSLTINNPSPTLTSINPTTTVVGNADFTLTLNGSGFANDSDIRWNGIGRATTFVSSTQLTTLIKAIEIVSSGTAKVSVFTPTPGGGTSGEQAFTLTPRPITTVSAASYTPTILGKDAIASAFGLEMATTSALEPVINFKVTKTRG